VRYASDDQCFWWSCFWWRVFRSSSSDSFLQTHSSNAVLQTHSSRCSKLQIKFLCSWTCSIRIFMNSTLIMNHVHLNKLFSISNWLFLIPCYCQNSIGDLWNTLCSNKLCKSTPPFTFLIWLNMIYDACTYKQRLDNAQLSTYTSINKNVKVHLHLHWSTPTTIALSSIYVHTITNSNKSPCHIINKHQHQLAYIH